MSTSPKPQIIATLLSLIFFSSGSQGETYFSAAVGSTNYGTLAEDVSSLAVSFGLRPIDVIAFEASYLDLGDTNIEFYGRDIHLGVYGVTLKAIVYAPITPHLDLFIEGGMYMWELDDTGYISTQTLIKSKGVESKSDLLLGAGINLQLSDELALRVSYQEIDVEGANIENLNAGFTIAF